MENVQIFGLYESILMNFVEAVAETDIPPFLNAAFQVLYKYLGQFAIA